MKSLIFFSILSALSSSSPLLKRERRPENQGENNHNVERESPAIQEILRAMAFDEEDDEVTANAVQNNPNQVQNPAPQNMIADLIHIFDSLPANLQIAPTARGVQPARNPANVANADQVFRLNQ